MSFQSTDQIEKQTNTEPLLSSGFLQCKSSFNEHTFDGGKFADLYSPGHTFNSTSIGMSKAPGFGHDFSLIPAHSDMVRQAMPSLKTGTMVQRFPEPTTEETPPAPEAAPSPAAPEPEEESAAPEETAAPALIVEDSVTELSAGQMRKSEFLAQLRAAVISTAESAMAGTGWTTADCPYITIWFGYYSLRSAQHGERALRRYAPEASRATTASEYIPIITQRVRRSVETWVRTGEVTGVPEGISTVLPGAGLLGQIGSIFFKARSGGARRANNPRAIQSQLGSGRSLDSGVRSRMESAFGMDFSHVRTHTDTTAAGLSDRLNARAFTVGEHVAFGSGEYQPGTLFGDALIAHEMAHVVQQRGASTSVAPMQTGSSNYSMLEKDADTSAIGVLASLWGSAKGKLADVAQNAIPRLRSGLSLQRCQQETCSKGNKSVSVDFVKLRGATGNPMTDLSNSNKAYKKCCVEFTKGENKTVRNDLSDKWLKGDTELDRSAGRGCGKVGGEEQAMFDGATAEYKLSSRMRVFYVERYIPNGSLAYCIPPYCATGAERPYVNHVVVKNNTVKNTLAHEFGHILLNSGSETGIDNPSDKNNLMYGPGTGFDLDKSQCKKIYNNA